MLLKNAVTQTSGTVLNRIERVTTKIGLMQNVKRKQLAKIKHTKDATKKSYPESSGGI
jgi:hypothetical protein